MQYNKMAELSQAIGSRVPYLEGMVEEYIDAGSELIEEVLNAVAGDGSIEDAFLRLETLDRTMLITLLVTCAAALTDVMGTPRSH